MVPPGLVKGFVESVFRGLTALIPDFLNTFRANPS